MLQLWSYFLNASIHKEQAVYLWLQQSQEKCLSSRNAQTQHCLGIAGSQAGGLMAAQEGATVKRFHSGRAGTKWSIFRLIG
jgi:hypothetical protein